MIAVQALCGWVICVLLWSLVVLYLVSQMVGCRLELNGRRGGTDPTEGTV